MIYEQDDGHHVVKETSITDFPRLVPEAFLLKLPGSLLIGLLIIGQQ